MTDSIHPEVRQNVLRGVWFQLPMVLVWGFRPAYVIDFDFTKFVSYGFGVDTASFMHLLGLTIMTYSMIRIYRRLEMEKLITTDLFAVTRHPMYHGMVIADTSLFFQADLRDPIFWATWVLFIALILAAGWFQEKETLARWRGEAEIYYERTPRFVFEWLWRWWH